MVRAALIVIPLLAVIIAASCSDPSASGVGRPVDTLYRDSVADPSYSSVDSSSDFFTWKALRIGHVWGCLLFSPKDILFVTDDVYKYDGTSFAKFPIAGLSQNWNGGLAEFRMVGSSDSDFWLYHSTILLHIHDGQAEEIRLDGHIPVWQYGRDGAVRAGWEVSPTDVYFACDSGSILHYSRGSWSVSPRVSPIHLISIAGRNASDIWAIGRDFASQGTALHFDGSAWTVNPEISAAVFTYGILSALPSTSHGHYYLDLAGYSIAHAMDGVVVKDTTYLAEHFDNRITGNGHFDLISYNNVGDVFHWNGRTWYREPGGNGAFSELHDGVMKGNTVCLVATQGLLVGQR